MTSPPQRVILVSVLLLFAQQIETLEFLDPSTPTEILVPANVASGDELLSEKVLRIRKESTEDVMLSFIPASDALSIAPDVVRPGGSFKLIANDPDELVPEYKLQALGVITGEQNTSKMKLLFESRQNDSDSNLIFSREVNEFHLSNGLSVSEKFLTKVNSPPSPTTTFNLIGPFAEHFVAYSSGSAVEVSSVVCSQCPELPREFSLLLVFSGPPQATTTIHFTVERRSNLHFPQTYETSVVEESSELTKTVKLRAGGTKPMYSLEDSSGIFSVHPTTGIVSVAHPEFLFIDTVGDTVNITAVASEDGKQSKTFIIIHVLSKSGEGQDLKFEKEELEFITSPGVREIGTLKIVHSGKKSVTYRISEGDNELFSVENGQLEYRGELMKRTKNYTLVVIAEDETSVAVTKVRVTIKGLSSHAIRRVSPEFIHSGISEEEKLSTKLATVVVEDKDKDALISFQISNSSARTAEGKLIDIDKSYVALEENSKEAYLLLAKSIVSENWISVQIILIATDKSHPLEPPVDFKITLLVGRTSGIPRPEAEFAFIKMASMLSISSNLRPNSVVSQLRTTAQRDVKFALTSESTQFAVNKNGTVSVLGPLLPGSKEKLRISATYKNSTAKTSLKLEVSSDKNIAPIISPLKTVILSENTEPGTVIANATLLQGSANFSLEGGEDFTIDDSGEIKLSNVLSSEPNEHLILVKAVGEFGTDVQKLRIIVEKPKTMLHFAQSQYFATIMENIAVNSFIVDVKVENSDQPVTYKVKTENGPAEFDIDSEGRVTVKEELPGPGTYITTITVTDGVLSATTQLNIDVKTAFSCQPIFTSNENTVFHIDENLADDIEIGRISAKKLDEKCNQRFYFYDSEKGTVVKDLPFAHIDEITGQITARKSFDFERRRNYPMVLEIQAGRQVTRISSELLINDIDDHAVEISPAEFSVEVPESASIGSIIATVQAHDRDITQKIVYHLLTEGTPFVIDSTGKISIVSQLDRETKDRYDLTVASSNEDTPGSSANSTIHVFIGDENDNGPVFERSLYEILVRKDNIPTKRLYTVRAVDPDIMPEEHMVFYKLRESIYVHDGVKKQMDGYFAVDQITGDIQQLEVLNEMAGGTFMLTIEASDSLESNERIGVTVVKVYIYDDSNVIRTELEKPLSEVQMGDLELMKKSIRETTGLQTVIREIRFHREENMLLHPRTDVMMVLVNPNTTEILPSDMALRMLRQPGSSRRLPPVSALNSETSTIATASISPIFLILAILIMGLILSTVVFSLLICYYRDRYRRARRLFDDDRAICDAIERMPKRRPVTPPTPPSLEPAPGYTVQERRMSVVADDVDPPRRRS